MNRKAVYIRLQTNAYLPSVGELGNVFPPQSKTLDNLVMTYWGSDGITLKFSYRGLNKEVAVPAANVSIVELAPEDSAKTAPVVVKPAKVA